MSLECLKKAASSVGRRLRTSENRRQPPLASNDSGLSLIRTPRDCGSSTASNPEKVSSPVAAGKRPPGWPPSPRCRPWLAEFFPISVATRRGSRGPEHRRASAKARKTTGFFCTARTLRACDDLLTMTVDNAEGAGL